MATKSKSDIKVETFLAACAAHGFKVRASDCVVTVSAEFTPGNNDRYIALEGASYCVLSMLGAKGGSTWGSDSGSIGGAVALRRGSFAMNRSGVPKRIIAALHKHESVDRS